VPRRDGDRPRRAATWKGIAISVGQPGVDVETRAPVLTTTACTGSGEVGSLVVVPTAGDDAEVGVKVVAGITRPPEECAASGYDGCIVSRRTLTYLAHQSQHVLIDLQRECIGNACDLNHTCVNGACSDTVTAAAPVTLDGSTQSGPVVRCGDDGTTCPANDTSLACCVAFDFDAGTGKGTCVAPHDCPSSSAVLYCDDSSDCAGIDADGGGTTVCVASTIIGYSGPVTNSACLSYALDDHFPMLCQDRQPCPVSTSVCTESGGAPGYYVCYAQ
jgi:hypothetical protein